MKLQATMMNVEGETASYSDDALGSGSMDGTTSSSGIVSQSEVLGRFYNPNTTPKDKERVVVCLHGTGQELH